MQSSTDLQLRNDHPISLIDILNIIIAKLSISDVLIIKQVSLLFAMIVQQQLVTRSEPVTKIVLKRHLRQWAKNPDTVKMHNGYTAYCLKRTDLSFFDRLTIYPPHITDSLFTKILHAAQNPENSYEKIWAFKMLALLSPYFSKQQVEVIIPKLATHFLPDVRMPVASIMDAMLAFADYWNEEQICMLITKINMSGWYDNKTRMRMLIYLCRHLSVEIFINIFEPALQHIMPQELENPGDALTSFNTLESYISGLSEVQYSRLLKQLIEILSHNNIHISFSAIGLLKRILKYITITDDQVFLLYNIALKKLSDIDISIKVSGLQILCAISRYLNNEHINKMMPLVLTLMRVKRVEIHNACSELLKEMASRLLTRPFVLMFNELKKTLNREFIESISSTNYLDVLIVCLPRLSKKRFVLVLKKLTQLCQIAFVTNGVYVYRDAILSCMREVVNHCDQQQLLKLETEVKNGLTSTNDDHIYSALCLFSAIRHQLSTNSINEILPNLNPTLIHPKLHIVIMTLDIFSAMAQQLTIDQFAFIYLGLINHLNHLEYSVCNSSLDTICALHRLLQKQQVPPLLTALANVRHRNSQYFAIPTLLSQLILARKCTLQEIKETPLLATPGLDFIYAFAERVEAELHQVTTHRARNALVFFKTYTPKPSTLFRSLSATI